MMLNITFHDEDDITVRVITLGSEPMIIIEPILGEDGEDVTFSMDVTGLDVNQLHTVLSGMVAYLEVGTVDGSTVEGFEVGSSMSLALGEEE